MNKILTNFSESAVIKAIEDNTADGYAKSWFLMKWEVYNESDMMRLISGIPYMMMNYVFRAQFTSDNIDQQITETLMPFKKRNLPMLWYTGPSTRPLDLGKHLEEHGLILYSNGIGMAADLQALNDNLSSPTDLTIERVSDVKTLDLWFDVFDAVYETPDFIRNSFYDIFKAIGFGENASTKLYVGLLNANPVACSQIILSAGVAGIYAVATIPEVRRQGIGRTITLAPLLEARAQGYRIGILQAFPEIFELYQQMGFKEYCKIPIYLWAGEQD